MTRKTKELPPIPERPRLTAAEAEPIRFDSILPKQPKFRRWYALYMITSLLAALLSLVVIVELKIHTNGSNPIGDTLETWADTVTGFLLPDQGAQQAPQPSPSVPTTPAKPTLTPELLYQFDAQAVPAGQIPIIPMDLSLAEYGDSYVHNLTGLRPDMDALLSWDFSKENAPTPLAHSSGPLVLIVHTHGTEGYSLDGAISYQEGDGEIARTDDPEQSVVAVGKTLSEHLNQLGIATVHCTVMHDQTQYKDSYARAEATIRRYLEQYPTIRLVIDVHRDSILKSTGEMVRPVSIMGGEAAAQVMCVVGSSWGGEENPNWEGNLALALQLRRELNAKYDRLCRPPYLKSSTYNQELAPYSLLLEVGACGNSLIEAKRTARAIAEILAAMVPNL